MRAQTAHIHKYISLIDSVDVFPGSMVLLLFEYLSEILTSVISELLSYINTAKLTVIDKFMGFSTYTSTECLRICFAKILRQRESSYRALRPCVDQSRPLHENIHGIIRIV